MTTFKPLHPRHPFTALRLMTDGYHTRRRFVKVGATVVALGTLAGCLDDNDDDVTDDTENDDEHLIMAGTSDDPFAFDPDTLEISSGDTVTWEWGTDTHNIHVLEQPDGADWPGEPEIYDTGHTYSYTFEVAGTYEYVCQPHEAQGMYGTIIVED